MKNNKLLMIIPECYVDTNLVQFLLNAHVNHQHCCSQVVGVLNTVFKDSFAVGIIDKDKNELGYIKDCAFIAKTRHLTLMRHKTRCQFLITISPAIDGFILDCAKEQKVDVSDYGFPSDMKGFTKITKSVTSGTNKQFKELFEAIQKDSEICTLKQTLQYLCHQQYSADDIQLRDLFSA